MSTREQELVNTGSRPICAISSLGRGERVWINPYRDRLRGFPDKLFTLENPDAERQRICSLLSSRSEIYLELGSGSGRHLLELGQRYPCSACVGFELRYKRAVRTMEKAQALDLANIYLIHADARLAHRILPHGMVNTLYVNFPDPWPKRRTEKHRLLNQDLLDICAQLLRDKGHIAVKTDSEQLFTGFCRLIERDSRYALQDVCTNLHKSSYAQDNIETEFEAMFRGKGTSIFYLKAQIVSHSACS